MADYNLAVRSSKQILTADGAGPLSIVISAVKPASSFVLVSASEKRRNVKVQRGVLSAVEAATSPVNAALATAVADLTRAHVVSSLREVRSGDARGASVKLSATNQVRLEWLGGALAAGEEIQAEYEVVEHILRRSGVRAYLIDETHIGIAWEGGTLEAEEEINVRYEVFDLESIGDDVKELLFRQQRALAYLGENLMQDLITPDDAGNIVSYRLRAFDTSANKALATLNVAAESPLETGEIGRINVTAAYSKTKGDPLSRDFDLEGILEPTPGVT